MSRRSWQQALDAFERHLLTQHQQLDESRQAALEPFSPPHGLGPLPAELRDRASTLLAQADRLTQRLAAQLGSTRRQVALTQRMGGGGRSAYLDHHV